MHSDCLSKAAGSLNYFLFQSGLIFLLWYNFESRDITMGSLEGKCLGEWVIVSGSVFLCWAVVLFPLVWMLCKYQCMCPSSGLGVAWEVETSRKKAPAKHLVGLYLWTFVSWISAQHFSHTTVFLPGFSCEIKTCLQNVLSRSLQVDAGNCRSKLTTVLLCSLFLGCMADSITVQSPLCNVFIGTTLSILPAPGFVAFLLP